jgi:hypothetical protein
MRSVNKAARLRLTVQIALLTAGAVLIIIGLHRGEAVVMLRKAVVVCMECIGIG